VEVSIACLVNVEAWPEWNAIDGRTDLAAFEPECSGWQPLGMIRSRALKLDRADNRAVTENTAGAARAIKTGEFE
jgi:hypothetical protein